MTRSTKRYFMLIAYLRNQDIISDAIEYYDDGKITKIYISNPAEYEFNLHIYYIIELNRFCHAIR